MDAATALLGALAQALSTDPAVAAVAHAVEPDRRAPAGPVPALTLAEQASADWSTKTDEGRELVVQLTAHARPGQLGVARGLLRDAERSLAAGVDVPGWQLVSWVRLRGAAAAGEPGGAAAGEPAGAAGGATGPGRSSAGPGVRSGGSPAGAARALAEWRARLLARP